MNGKLVDIFHFYDDIQIDYIVRDHETVNNLIIVASKSSNKFWLCSFRNDLDANTMLVIGHDFIPAKDENGDDIGILDEVGFVEMTSEKKVLLFSTDKLLLISVEVQGAIDFEEDPRYNIQLNPLSFVKFYGKLFPETNRIRINYESKRAHIYGYEERSRVWQKIWRLETLPNSPICNMKELKISDLKQTSKDISDVEVVLQTQFKDTNIQQL